MTEPDLAEQIRRSLDRRGSIALDDVMSRAWQPQRSKRQLGRSAKIAPVLVAAGVAAAVTVGLTVPGNSQPNQRINFSAQPGTSIPTTPSPTAGAASAPVDAGTEEQLDPTSAPFDPTTYWGPDGIHASSYLSFTLVDGPWFGVAPKATDPVFDGPGRPPTTIEHGVAVFHVSNSDNPPGPEADFQPYNDSNTSPVQVIPDWPQTGQQLYVWATLPTNTAYVTYHYNGAAVAWERPSDGVVGLLVPRPDAFDGDYATWHTAPFGTLTAYNANGASLSEVQAPRVPGDDMKTGPTGNPVYGTKP